MGRGRGEISGGLLVWSEFAERVSHGVWWVNSVPGGVVLCLYVYAVECEARTINGEF